MYPAVILMLTRRVLSRRFIGPSPAVRYAVAVIAAALAVLLRLALEPLWGIRLPFITLFPAIMFSAWVGGLGPGLLTTVITGAAAVYYWVEPARSFTVGEISEMLGVLVFVLVGGVISALNEAWRRGTARLAESEERFRVTLKSIGDAVITTDDQGRVTDLNEIAQQLTGWSAADAAGKPLHDVLVIVNEQTRQPADNPVERVLREGGIVGMANHTILISKDGREIPIDDSAAPIRGDKGGVAGVVMVFRDISERRRAEREREWGREQADFLSEASARLASSLDYEETLKTIARLAVPAVADWCAVDVVDAGGAIRRLAVAHVDPAKVELAHIIHERYGEDPESPYGVHHVVRTGAPTMVTDIPDRLLVEVARDEEHLRILRQIGLRSYMRVPMNLEGRTLGVLTFVTEKERRYSEMDLRFAEQIASRAALAIANARAYSEARRLAHELSLAQERATQLVESVPGVVWEAWGQPDAASQRIDFVSGYVESMLGYSVDEWQRTPNFWLTIVHPDDRQQAAAAAAAAFASGQPHTNQFRWIAKDGRVLWVEARSMVIQDGSGAPVGMRGITFDITERKQVLIREQAAREEIERASRLKDEFLAVLSHELRTPLNAVLGYAHLLRSAALPPERTDHALEAIQRNAQAQSRLVESLLDLSRVMAGKLELNLEPLNISKVIESAVDVIRPQAEAKRITLVVVPPPREVALVGDGSRLQQVFWNLLSNAIKFTPAAGTVAVRCEEEGAQLRVLVTDNGHGIAADFLPYVFDRFTQSDSHKRRSTTGLGLGLALVREMVQAHGGDVVAESPGEGHGSTFTVTLPLSISAVAAATQKRPARQADEAESLAPIEVLIVDDEADVRELLALLLESRGAIARCVSSASEAMDAISQRPPHVLLADIRMPDEDGYSLIRRVRARERERQGGRLPAIAVTAYASPRDRDQALAAGFDSHVAKPVEPAELARVVASVTRRFRQGQATV